LMLAIHKKLRRGRRALRRAGCIIILAGIAPAPLTANGSEVYATEAARFISLQRDNYRSMLTGQNRLKRACSVPVVPSGDRTAALPDLGQLKTELSDESKRFSSRASTRYSAAKRDQSLQCKNPVGKVLELFGAKSGCSEAEENTAAAQKILKSASDWEEILELQMTVLEDAAALERQACLSAGFTAKLTRAYTDSVRPNGSSLSRLFDRWTSAE
jgi:hypothetical protein